MRLDAIARELGFTIGGQRDLEVRGLRYANDALPEDLAVARTLREGRQTRARAVLIKGGILPGKTLLYCSANPEKGGIAAALARTALFFVQRGEAPDYDKAPRYQALANYPGVMAGKSVSIGEGTVIQPFTVLGDNVAIGRGTHIASGVMIGSGTAIGDNGYIDSGARVGSAAFFHYRAGTKRHVFNGIGRVSVGSNVTIGANAVIQRGALADTRIDDGARIGSLVVIGHDAHIGKNCLIVSQAGISGQVIIGDEVSIFGQAGIGERICIGHGSIIMAQSRVSKDVQPGEIISGDYNKRHKTELRFRATLERMALENGRKIS